jgi:hypothetical protein
MLVEVVVVQVMLDLEVLVVQVAAALVRLDHLHQQEMLQELQTLVVVAVAHL